MARHAPWHGRCISLKRECPVAFYSSSVCPADPIKETFKAGRTRCRPTVVTLHKNLSPATHLSGDEVSHKRSWRNCVTSGMTRFVTIFRSVSWRPRTAVVRVSKTKLLSARNTVTPEKECEHIMNYSLGLHWPNVDECDLLLCAVRWWWWWW